MRAQMVAAALVGTLACSCAQNGTLVVVELSAAPPVDGVATIAVSASASGMQRTFEIAAPRATIPPPMSIGIEVPPSVTGTMHVALEARDGAGTTLASAAGDVTLATGAVARLPLSLVGGGESDGGALDLAAPAGDLANVPRDLASPADLAPPPPDLLAPALVFLPNAKDFMAVNEGSASGSFQFTVQNNGTSATGPLQAPTITGTHAAQFTIDNNTCLAGLVLTVNATCTVTVTFRPTGAGMRSAIVAVTDGSRSGSATLTGRAVGTVGRACGGAADCQNGQCVDGYCCNVASCTGCNACNVATKEGTCSPVPVGTDPRGFCTQPCADKCDGAGACRPKTAGAVCQTVACTNVNAGEFQWRGTTSGVRKCDGSGLSCPTGSGPCASSLTCNTTTGACRTSCANDTECIEGTWCNAGACESPRSGGQPCTRMLQCMNLRCVNGSCSTAYCDSTKDCTSYPFVCGVSGGVQQCYYCQEPSRPSFNCNGTGAGNSCAATSDGRGYCSCASNAECGDTAPSCELISGYTTNGNKMCTCRSGSLMRCKAYSVCMNPGANGYCALRSGTPCLSGSLCASGVCTNGVCQ